MCSLAAIPCAHGSEDQAQGIWSYSRSRARVQGGGRRRNVRCYPGTDLSPGLTWAAARTFWYKLFPWRGSGGPENTAGRARETALSGHC